MVNVYRSAVRNFLSNYIEFVCIEPSEADRKRCQERRKNRNPLSTDFSAVALRSEDSNHAGPMRPLIPNEFDWKENCDGPGSSGIGPGPSGSGLNPSGGSGPSGSGTGTSGGNSNRENATKKRGPPEEEYSNKRKKL